MKPSDSCGIDVKKINVYNLKYLGKIGNVFHTKDIEAAIEKGRKYNPDDFSPWE